MAAYLKGQMDYIYFFYGLGFIILAAVCSILRRGRTSVCHGASWGSFGLVHGLYEWMDLAVVSFEVWMLPRALRILVMAASFAILAEFGRAGLVRVRGRGPGRRSSPAPPARRRWGRRGPERPGNRCTAGVRIRGGLWRRGLCSSN